MKATRMSPQEYREAVDRRVKEIREERARKARRLDKELSVELARFLDKFLNHNRGVR